MAKNKIEPSMIITVDLHNYQNIPIVVTNSIGNVLDISSVNRFLKSHIVRTKVIDIMNDYINKYSIDTILFEENKLFTDTISLYPDFYVMQNVKLNYGIQVAIEDNYWNKVNYIIELPKYEWEDQIFNNKGKCSFERYKKYIQYRNNIMNIVPTELIETVDINNYYRALCLSTSILSDKLMNRKYQINKGE